MGNSERAEIQAELARLKAKAEARRNQPGFAANVQAIDARIAEVEAQLAGG